MKIQHMGLAWTRSLFRQRSEPGAAPGVINVDPGAHATRLRVLEYGPEDVREREVDDVDDLENVAPGSAVTWIDVTGLGDADALHALAQRFGLHPLLVEDVVNVNQRPKVEQYGEVTFAVMRFSSMSDGLAGEQLSLVLGDGFLLTFQERPGDGWDPVRRRIREGRGRIRTQGADYLFYALLDAVVDHLFPELEDHIDRIDALEGEVLASPVKAHVKRIQALKHEFLALRRDVWPLREAVSLLVREDFPHFTAETRTYLRDCLDHVQQAMDLMEGLSEHGTGLMDLYLSTVSNRANDVMKVLTVIATIFIPLTFIAGIYGMNFERTASPYNMPELDWAYGYPVVMGAMAVFAVALLLVFGRWGWLDRGQG